MDASRLSRLEPYNYVLRIVTYVLSKLLDLLATKGIRGILDGTIVKNGEGVPASALTISIDIWACRIKGARLNS